MCVCGGGGECPAARHRTSSLVLLSLADWGGAWRTTLPVEGSCLGTTCAGGVQRVGVQRVTDEGPPPRIAGLDCRQGGALSGPRLAHQAAPHTGAGQQQGVGLVHTRLLRTASLRPATLMQHFGWRALLPSPAPPCCHMRMAGAHAAPAGARAPCTPGSSQTAAAGGCSSSPWPAGQGGRGRDACGSAAGPAVAWMPASHAHPVLWEYALGAAHPTCLSWPGASQRQPLRAQPACVRYPTPHTLCTVVDFEGSNFGSHTLATSRHRLACVTASAPPRCATRHRMG